jgi:hypothetical protein
MRQQSSQIGLGLKMYLHDNFDRFPPFDTTQFGQSGPPYACGRSRQDPAPALHRLSTGGQSAPG